MYYEITGGKSRQSPKLRESLEISQKIIFRIESKLTSKVRKCTVAFYFDNNANFIYHICTSSFRTLNTNDWYLNYLLLSLSIKGTSFF